MINANSGTDFSQKASVEHAANQGSEATQSTARGEQRRPTAAVAEEMPIMTKRAAIFTFQPAVIANCPGEPADFAAQPSAA